MNAERMIRISTKAGPETLVVQRFSGREELARLFEYQLELVSERADIRPADLLGTNATVSVDLPGGAEPRHFNGYISQFTVQGETRTPAFKSGVGYLYTATLHPWLWFLSRTATCQIFQEQTYEEVLKAVLDRWPALKALDLQLVGATEKREFLVQYRETDFNFVSRLMEQAGLYYQFAHENGRHRMVVVNHLSRHKPAPGLPTLDFHPIGPDAHSVEGWCTSAQLQAGAYALDDFNPTTPRASLSQVAALEGAHANAGFEIFDFPGEYPDASWGQTYARIRVEELHCQHEVAHFSTEQRSVQVGCTFRLTNHPVKAENRDYLVTQHRFSAVNNLTASAGGQGASFHAEVTVIPAKVQFRPARITPKPSIPGLQTAFVVGPAGEEIETDAMGRIRVRFHWDRYAQGSDKDSCWLRVSQSVAGKGWGALHLPRVGQEVTVAFLDGDPDRPLITGTVGNGLAPPPYKLPDHKTRSGWKTHSYKGGNDQFNELRFDDKGGAEQVYLQAQKDFDLRVKADEKVFIGGESHRIVGKAQHVQVKADAHLQVKGDHNSQVGGSLSFAVSQSTHLKGKDLLVDESAEIHLKAGMKLVLEAGTQLSLKVGGNFIDIGPAGVTIQGTLVQINSGGSAGSGTGAKPIEAKVAKEALESEGGEADKPPAPRTKPQRYGPQATIFKTAAKSGAPFCQVCQGC